MKWLSTDGMQINMSKNEQKIQRLTEKKTLSN